MIVNINNYPYAVPYLKNEDGFVLKTIYPDRRYKKLLEKNDENNIQELKKALKSL